MAKLTIQKTTDEDYTLAYVLKDVIAAAQGVEQVTATVSAEWKGQPQAVTLSGPPEQIAQVFRHFYTSDERVLSAAENIEYRKYRAIIENAAKGIRDEIANGEHEDADAESLLESIESAGEVVYYSEAALTMRHTTNGDADNDEIGEAPEDECVQASCAQVADIREELGDLEDLFDRLAPLSDDEKERAADELNILRIQHDPEPDTGDLYAAIAEDIRDTDAGQEKVIAYLTALNQPST